MKGRGRLARPVVVIALFVLSTLLVLAPARASAQSIGCGSTITKNTTLSANIGPCSGNGLIVGTSGITLNCAGYAINLNGESGVSAGVSITGRTKVTVENCNITGFDNSNGHSNAFQLSMSSGDNLTNDTANGNYLGFSLANSSNNKLTKSTANGNAFGFGLFSSGGNTLIGDTANSNTLQFNSFGFQLYESSNNTLTKNNANINSYDGFSLYGSSRNLLANNTANSNGNQGFDLSQVLPGVTTPRFSTDNIFIGNTANYNKQYGYLDSSTGSGTAGTANSYTFGVCGSDDDGGSSPAGLCPPFVSLNPPSGVVGALITVTGANLLASHDVTTTFDGSAIEMPTSCSTNSTGGIESGCTFTVPPSVFGLHTVTASDGTSVPTASFTVTPQTTTSTATLSGGSATVDQTSTTGIKVTISASTAQDGTSVTVNSQVWGTTQPPGESSVSLSSTNFFDVQTKGITDGTAEVCITNASVTPATVMQYWYGKSWPDAAGQAVTGTTVCGEIPVLALLATPIALGILMAGGTLATVSCSKASVTVGTPLSCKATVSGSKPTGMVAWSSSSLGKFSKPTCMLTKGACSVEFTPTAAGPVILVAKYGGDPKNSPSIGANGLTALTKATKTTVSCRPTSAIADSSTIVTCTARVVGYTPTGAVTWSQSGTGTVAFFSLMCNVVSFKNPDAATCSVTLTGATAGSVTITANYSGDSNNQGSSNTRTLTIR